MRLAGTKRKHDHDSLHLLRTAEKKINKAYKRMPTQLTGSEKAALIAHAEDIRVSLRNMLIEMHRREEV